MSSLGAFLPPPWLQQRLQEAQPHREECLSTRKPSRHQWGPAVPGRGRGSSPLAGEGKRLGARFSEVRVGLVTSVRGEGSDPALDS